MSNGPMHYRLADHWTESGEVTVDLEKFHVMRETPCGYWVLSDYCWHYQQTWPEYAEKHKRWVPKLGSRYCHASIEEALQHYSIRKRHELRHIQARLDKCQQVLGHWDELKLETLEAEGEVNLGQPGSRAFTFSTRNPNRSSDLQVIASFVLYSAVTQ